MKEQFVTYSIAKKLKELGFSEKVFAHFNTDKNNNLELHKECKYGLGYHTPAPLWQQALDWFRDRHKLHIEVERDLDGWCYKITEFASGNKFKCSGSLEMPDHNKELEKAILKAFELIKV